VAEQRSVLSETGDIAPPPPCQATNDAH